MKMIPVTSSNIAEIGYEPESRYLVVKFKHGNSRRHEDVEPKVWGQFLAAESKGKFYAAEIKGKYQSFKIAADQPTGEGAA